MILGKKEQLTLKVLNDLDSLFPGYDLTARYKGGLLYIKYDLDTINTAGQCGPIGWDPKRATCVIGIEISKYITENDLLEAKFINTLYHELAHAIQYIEAERIGVCVFNAKRREIAYDKDNPKFDFFFGEETGHEGYWQSLADKINSSLNPDIEITAFIAKEEFNKAVLLSQDKLGLVVKCSGCNYPVFYAVANENEFMNIIKKLDPMKKTDFSKLFILFDMILRFLTGESLPEHSCGTQLKLILRPNIISKEILIAFIDYYMPIVAMYLN